MKAVVPLRSRPAVPGLLPGPLTRSKSPALPEEQRLLADTERCYRLLRAMVPGLPPGRSLSRVDLLQRVIDYILDLQAALEPGPVDYRRNQDLPDHQSHPGGPPSAVPSAVCTLTFQPSERLHSAEPPGGTEPPGRAETQR
ncbi:unnamed protein product [Merluccius merluccius]